jgi:iron complex outermembrane receptor protein
MPAFAASPVATHATDSQADAAGPIEEIIVTAERRQETVQKSSVSVQVVSAEGLERGGVTQATDLNRIAPGILSAAS